MALAPFEQEFLERLNSNPNPLGWAPCGRDENGVAQVRCRTEMPDGYKITVIKIKEEGLEYHQRKYTLTEEAAHGTG